MYDSKKIDHKQIGVYYQDTLKNGRTSYRKELWLGRDKKTGKDALTTVTAASFKELKTAIEEKKHQFRENGNVLAPSGSGATFREAGDAYLKFHLGSLRLSTQIRTEAHFQQYIYPVFGHLLIDKITAAMVQDALNRWKAAAQEPYVGNKRPKGTIGSYWLLLSYVKRVLAFAEANGLITESPARGITASKPRKAKNGRLKFLDEKRSATLLKYVDHFPERGKYEKTSKRLYARRLINPYLRLLLLSGMRSGEALALEWKDIDWPSRRVRVMKTLNERRKLNPTKSPTGRRNLLLDSKTVEVLKEWRACQASMFSEAGKPLPVYVFQSYKDDLPISQPNAYSLAQTIFKKCGLPSSGLHVLRHTHVSLLLNAGVNYKEIQVRLGHKDFGLTMNTYGHLFDSQQRQMLDTFVAYIGTHSRPN